jgi:hypothetical protein
MLSPILPNFTQGSVCFKITIIPLVICTTHIHHNKHAYIMLKLNVYVSNYLNVTKIKDYETVYSPLYELLLSCYS